MMLRRESKKLNLTGNARYEGYCIDLLDKIAKMRNFTYEIHEVHDKTYGVREGQRWNGMVGELMSKVGRDEDRCIVLWKNSLGKIVPESSRVKRPKAQ